MSQSETARGPDRRGGKTIVRESAADRARRMLVVLSVGPSRTVVLAVIGSVALFVVALVIGYLTRQ